jgi:predicted permease
MAIWRSVRAGVRRLLRRDQAERDLRDELAHYLAMATEENIRRGLTPDAAARAARVSMGSLEGAKADVRAFGWDGAIDAIRQDVRLALRGLRRDRAFALTAILSLAVGVGALTAMFSLLNAVLLRPLPYRDADRLTLIWTNDARRGLHREATAYSTIADWAAQTHAFSHIAYFSTQRIAPMTNDPNGARGRSRSALVSANFFDVLGAAPLAGRLLTSDDERERAPVVVVSYSYWQRWLDGAPDAVGRSIRIDDPSKGGLSSMTVVGILPPDFFFPDRQTEVFTPATTYWRFARESTERFPSWARRWTAVGRLAPGRSVEDARAELDRIGAQLALAHPTTLADFPGFSTTVLPVIESIAGARLQSALWMLLAAVATLLLVVCGNLATLMLARGSSRQHEFAVQRALGAGRGRVVRQVLTETFLLVSIGASIGTALAAWTMPAVAAMAAAYLPRMEDVAFDRRVWLSVVAASLVCGIIFGVLPALRVSAVTPTHALRDGGRSTSTPGLRRSQRLLVFAQCALALVLLAGAGLLLKSLARLYGVDAGFNASHVLTLRLELPSERPPTAAERTQTSAIGQARASVRAQALHDTIDRIAGIPGVRAVGAIDDLFLSGGGNHSITVPGRGPDQIPAGELSEAMVASSFFETMGQPLRRGRMPSRDDVAQKIRALWSPLITDLPLADKERRATPEPVVVNDAFVQRFFPAEDPLGRRFCIDPDNKTYWYEIVGVVGNTRRGGLERAVIPEYYGPLIPSAGGRADLVVRTTGDPVMLAPAVRAEVERTMPQARIASVSTAEAQLAAFSAQRRLQTWLLTAFALLAVVLAAIGIFGVAHYAAAERTQEIGIRVALGAAPGDVLRLLLADGLRMPLLGILAGLIASAGLSRLIASQLYDVTATDPATFVSVAVALTAVAASACVLAAWRASHANPVQTLRSPDA